MKKPWLLLATSSGSAVHAQFATNCSASTFSSLTLYGAQILSVTAAAYTNQTVVPITVTNVYPEVLTNLTYCEVNVTYTHPGYNDTINVQVWLPSAEAWTGRFIGVGGGGWTSTLNSTGLAGPVSRGFSAASTDAGHVSSGLDYPGWGLLSPGNVNWVLLQDFAAIALDDLATLGKEVSTAYYGTAPHHSYWNGCSTGGRQGHMMAQRYPKQYDGIVASAPTIHWANVVPGFYSAQFAMNQLGQYPRQCELQAIRQAAIEACDEIDGVVDGIIAYPGLCDFNATSVVGQSFYCSETNMTMQISSAAAVASNALWQGPRTVDGKFLWYGVNRGADPSALAGTICTDSDGIDTRNCTGLPLGLSSDWIRVFVKKDMNFDPTTMSHRDYDTAMKQSYSQYDSIIGTSDADLTGFRDAGGKLITWHGLADQAVPTNGTVRYYDRLLAKDPQVNDYYRFFEAPGVAHCAGGRGWFPGDVLDSIVRWVEDGVAPETLAARTVQWGDGSEGNVTREANLCLYPKKITYVGGDINIASSFMCQ